MEMRYKNSHGCIGTNIVFALIVLAVSATMLPMPIAAESKSPPAAITATLIVKLIALEKNLASQKGDFTIYVLGDPEVAKELKKGIGRSIGSNKLKNVLEGDTLPKDKPTCLFIGDVGKYSKAVAYTREKKILSITDLPELVKKGVSLGIGVSEASKPKIYLNLTSSLYEGLNWNRAILKRAETMK